MVTTQALPDRDEPSPHERSWHECSGHDATAGPVHRRWTSAIGHADTWDPRPGAVVVVVPHPDDEVLLFGGLVHLLRRRRTAVHVLAVTDGESAYADADPARLGTVRAEEQDRALRTLGADAHDVTRLRLPDGDVAEHVDGVCQAVDDAVAASGATLLLAPWVHDHHPDHEACGRAARRVADRHGLALGYGLFWTWHHGSPDDLARRRLLAVPLDRPAQAARRGALAHHRSQFVTAGDPILDERLVEPARWTTEYYVSVDAPQPHDVRRPGGLVRPGSGVER